MPSCLMRPYIDCDVGVLHQDGVRCRRCGWDPAVEKVRKEKNRAKLAKRRPRTAGKYGGVLWV